MLKYTGINIKRFFDSEGWNIKDGVQDGRHSVS